MKLSAITSLLTRAALPSLSREQLLQLAGTAAGRQFEADLLRFDAGNLQAARDLEIVVRALSPQVKASVERLGLKFDLEMFIPIARQAGRNLFAALDASDSNTARRSDAVKYLAGLARVGGGGTAAAKPASTQALPAPYYSFKIYGKGAALCVSEARTRTGNFHTIQIEGAAALPGGQSKQFDWPNKITIQLTTQEAYQTLALFENKIASLKFDGHGVRHDKCLQIEFQESNYFVRLIQKGKPALSVPVRPVDGLPIVSLIYKQILLNEPHMDLGSVRSMVDRMVQMM